MTTLYYEETGTPGAPSIVFLHGIGASGWMWGRQIAALADFHCLNVDLPGHGQSSSIAWVSLADTCDRVAALIRARATNGRAHLVGLSLGGYVALVLLERHADLAARIVVSGVTATPMPNRIFLNPQLWWMSLVMHRRWFIKSQANAMHVPLDMQAAFAENLLAVSIQTYRRIYEEAVDFRLPAALGGVDTPVLVTAGGRESQIILQALDVIPASMPNAQGRLAPGVGHGWNVEAPDLFTAMIRAWITGSPLPGGLRTPHGGMGRAG